MFTGNRAPWRMEDFRVFGSPVFVLDKKLQDGDTLSKWKARSWVGVYVGHSLAHSGNVPVIYNPQTTHITPQFHVVFDDQFSTVTGNPSQLTDKYFTDIYNSSSWLHKDKYADTDDLHLFDTYWSSPPLSKSDPKKYKKLKRNHATSVDNSNILLSTPPSDRVNNFLSEKDNRASELHGEHAHPSELAIQRKPANTSNHAQITHETSDNTIIPSEPAEQSAQNELNTTLLFSYSAVPETFPSQRINLVPTQCSLPFSELKATLGIKPEVYTTTTNRLATESPPKVPVKLSCPDNFISLLTYSHLPETRPYHPTAFHASNNKEDTLTQSQMLKTSDSASFIECQRAEIEGLRKFDVMDIKKMADLPAKAKLISSIWSYRRKRLPNGVLGKCKSRICANGKEHAFGRDYWETYDPVASWATIRLLMLLSTLLDLKTRQVDYTQAVPQATLDEPVYMKVPQGWFVDLDNNLSQHTDPKFNDTTHYLQLKKNLYGCKQVARN
jgi:hypothetical protein